MTPSALPDVGGVTLPIALACNSPLLLMPAR